MQKQLILAAAICWAAWPALAQQTADAVQPEAESSIAFGFAGLSDEALAGLDAKASGTPVAANDWMIAAANPWAV